MDNDQEKAMKEEEERKRQRMSRIAKIKCILNLCNEFIYRYGRKGNAPKKISHIFWKTDFS
jgi:hypothetical protein